MGPLDCERHAPIASTKQVCDDQLLRIPLGLLLVGGGIGDLWWWGHVSLW